MVAIEKLHRRETCTIDKLSKKKISALQNDPSSNPLQSGAITTT